MHQQKSEISLSKFMTRLLRHTPESHGLTLDPEDGSCPFDQLVAVIQAEPRWRRVTAEDIRTVVANSDKQRFEIRGDRIRARYGHSHDKVQYTPGTPPAVLYHGTNTEALPSILREGLRPMNRKYVHLSEGTHFAAMAGSRRGELVMLTIDTGKAESEGVAFYYAGNEVWLAEAVPASCCTVLDGKDREG
ncbi:RNA 2'-phosphotransferase [Paenibacillus sp. OAS669]|uniref:RNA 2'-phosphotransferase n=1 Tax=Paenibacillus sp. OAS669 TaxID=2663821 RepID=UPI00178A4B6B|nr:RNA 2'-phosphotransferase [Paenibacillus sp. OAS669]MBE1444687.1 putative RNA 2'-phosphotransferase [Paenibacillus sp. OAS669]